jgi:hypothetical protein
VDDSYGLESLGIRFFQIALDSYLDVAGRKSVKVKEVLDRKLDRIFLHIGNS